MDVKKNSNSWSLLSLRSELIKVDDGLNAILEKVQDAIEEIDEHIGSKRKEQPDVRYMIQLRKNQVLHYIMAKATNKQKFPLGNITQTKSNRNITLFSSIDQAERALEYWKNQFKSSNFNQYTNFEIVKVVDDDEEDIEEEEVVKNFPYVIMCWGQDKEPYYYAGVGNKGADDWTKNPKKAYLRADEGDAKEDLRSIRWFPDRGEREVCQVGWSVTEERWIPVDTYDPKLLLDKIPKNPKSKKKK